MRRFMRFFQDKFYIEILLASALFLIALSVNMMLEFIIYMLYFIIYLEIVRAVINYIREQRVIISFLVDAFIILALRELIVNLVKINNEKIDSIEALLASSLNYNIMIISGVIIFLFVVRYLSIKTAPKYLIDKMKKENNNK
ncbi:MAG: phosphate-starvation-inducible PsiE family protein [Campylobacteraceae bacterium]|nr:phosphate-starvation-inducible PsiE family protein [Campylobacteraceae bacterium]